MHILTTSVVLASLFTGSTPEWGGFRGPNGSGLAVDASMPATLDPEHNALWRVEIPGGYSSPIVSGPRVFLTAAEGKELLTLCFERSSGEELWRRAVEFDGKRPGANSPAAPTPATDGEHVVVLFHSFGLLGYDLAGEELWRRPLGPFNIPHGLSTSPRIHDGRVVVCIDQDGGSYLAAFDVKSGEPLWRVERPEATHGYSTPAIWQPAEGPAQIVVAGSLEVAGFSFEDGSKIWWADVGCWQTKAVPVVAGDRVWINSYMVGMAEMEMPVPSGTFEELLADKDANENGFVEKDEWDHAMMQRAWFIFDLDDDGKLDARDWDYMLAAGRRTGGLYSIQLGGEGDVTDSHVRWEYTQRRGMSDVITPVVIDGVLLLVKESGITSTFDAATGELLEQERVGDEDDYYASPVAAGKRVLLTGKSGQLSVLAVDREWQELSNTSLSEETWATPALAGDQVFVRSMQALYCFQGEVPASEGDK